MRVRRRVGRDGARRPRLWSWHYRPGTLGRSPGGLGAFEHACQILLSSEDNGGGTVSASILGSFDFVVALFTPPVTAPVMLAAAHERLADVPHGAAPGRSVEDMLGFADNMLSGATWRSGRLR